MTLSFIGIEASFPSHLKRVDTFTLQDSSWFDTKFCRIYQKDDAVKFPGSNGSAFKQMHHHPTKQSQFEIAHANWHWSGGDARSRHCGESMLIVVMVSLLYSISSRVHIRIYF